MTYNSGKLITIFVVAVLLSCVTAWLVAWRYRKSMQRLMRVPMAGAQIPVASPVQSTNAPPVTPWPVSLADNRRAGIRLTLLLIGLSCLIAVTSASLYLLLALPDLPFAPKRAAAVALLHLWPVIPALALMWRWSRKRLLGVLVLWFVVCFFIFQWRSIESKPMQVLLGIALEVGPSMVLIALIFFGHATRAVAPWLLLPFTGLVWVSIIGVDALGVLVNQYPSLVRWLPAVLGDSWSSAIAAMVLFAVLPWLLAWWPLRRLGRALGRAYTRKQLSELMVVFTTVWAFSLVERAIGMSNQVGVAAVAMFLPLLWIPPVMLLYAKWQTKQGRPPTLLVLRVFQHDAQVQDLFDHVIERWRLSGNTVMIAGTDLADRTIDADDIFTFLDGGLAARFIRTPLDVTPRIAAFDRAADADGRYRVNECYCHDTTWQDALRALVQQSDVVLMDLRGFQARNAGCRFELGTLAQAAQALRVVVLADAQTDRAAAAEAIGHAPPQRFVWLDAAQIDARKRREVLASLFGAGENVVKPPR